MSDQLPTYTAFLSNRRLAHGPLADVAIAVKRAESAVPVLIFDDGTGRQLDVDTRGSDDEIRARYAPSPAPPRGRGRPKLGVVPREVTLLPRHWEWLNAQQGGASVTLRRLVDEARRASGDAHVTKAAHERAYHFMYAIAGDFTNYEEATRALFANDRARLEELTQGWPPDIRAHALMLAFAADFVT
ncbi:MAG TPA: DUF2239 family protein [Gemmatimonadaceae bacterium]|jgi:hypothetical protein